VGGNNPESENDAGNPKASTLVLACSHPQNIQLVKSDNLLDLLLWGVVPNFEPNFQTLLKHVLDFSELSTAKGESNFNAMIPFGHSGLHVPTAPSPMSPDILDVYRGGHDFNVVQGELGTLSNDVPVDGDHGTSVVVEPVSVAPLLISIQINTTEL
jgi:hypothetical protein